MASPDFRTEDAELTRLLRREGPMNLPRAIEVMDACELEGLVLGDPLNVFHALGYWPQIARTKAGQPPTSFALLSRRPGAAPGFVTTRFIFYYTWADGRFERELETWLYSDAGDDGDASPGPESDLFPDRGVVPLSEIERRRRTTIDAVPGDRRSLRDAGAALVKAMRGLGLWHGRIGFDHPVVAAVCAHHGHPGSLVPADNILRRIRMIKSPLEIRLMQRASAANVEAVHAVAQSLRAGAEYQDLRRVYEVEVSRRGNRTVFLTLDRVSSELSEGTIRDGQALFIDGVSHFRNYHGDYARTVFVGEPAGAARLAAAAMAAGWNAVRERLRPGLRYSELTKIGRDAVRAAGYDSVIGFGPHSVGLMHTDEPGEEAGGFYRKADLVLQENMILSVDCPVMETGFGGSAHMEDLMLITADGAVPIHALAEPVIIL